MSRNYLKLTQDKLDVSTLCQLASAPNCGAISLFVGTTRDSFESKTVVKLEYEAYESMALKSLERVCTDIRNKWRDVENIVIYHRLGEVPVQEPSIVIAISSPHRKDAIQATEWCIDTVKKTIPIWKKEVYTESAPEWKENKESVLGMKPSIEPHGKKKKLPKISRDEFLHKSRCYPVPENPQDNLVHAPTTSEVDNRVDTYKQTRRNDIDARNVRNYCIANKNPEHISCARIDSVLRKNHNSVLVTRVYNPLIRDEINSEYLTRHFSPDGISERFAKLEYFLDPLASIPKDIYVRLKCLEDRMLCVESISPGYKDFWVIPQQSNFEVQITSATKRRIATIQDIDRIIEQMESDMVREKRQKIAT